MTEVRGALTTLNNSLPLGVDAGAVLNWRLADGYSYAQTRADVGASLDGWNRGFLEMWGDLIYLTDQDYLEYPNGGAVTDFRKDSELDRVELFKGDVAGHSIGIDWYTKGMGGSERFFRLARRSIIESTTKQIMTAAKNTIEKAILNRLFSRSETQLTGNAYSVGMASASQTVPFTPMEMEGGTFLSSHDHYNYYDDASVDYDDMLDGIATDVLEHGSSGRGIYLVSEADIATVKGFTTKYVQPFNGVVQINGGSTSTPVLTTPTPMATMPRTGGRFFGYWSSPKGEFELRASNRIPTGYAAFFLSQGGNVRGNPIAVRFIPDIGFGYYIKEIPNDSTTFPVKEIDIEAVWGIGAGEDRVSACLGYIANGAAAWVAPTIS